MNVLLGNKKGFTLIEVIVTIAIASIIALAIYSSKSFSLNIFRFGTSQAEIQQDVRLIDKVFKEEVRNAIYIGDTSEDSKGIKSTREIYLSSDNNFHYGKSNILSTSNTRDNTNTDIVLTSFNPNTSIIKYEIIIETIRNKYSFENSILLNNTVVESGSSPYSLKDGKLYYRLHGEGEN